MTIGIVRAMRLLAQVKHPGQTVKPFTGKTWTECYEHYPDIKTHYLGYLLNDEKTSHSIALQYGGNLEIEETE